MGESHIGSTPSESAAGPETIFEMDESEPRFLSDEPLTVSEIVSPTGPEPKARRFSFFKSSWVSAFTVLAGIAGVGTLILSAITYIAPNGSTTASDLRVVRVEVNTLKDVETSLEFPPEFDEPSEVIRQNDATIEVTLENRGNGAALIESATAEFSYLSAIERCSVGAGPVTVTGLYDIGVAPGSVLPLTVTSDLSFEVSAASFDRLGITVGPKSRNEGDYPSLYRLSLALNTSSGRTLRVGPVALLSSTEYADNVIGDLVFRLEKSKENAGDGMFYRECFIRNYQALQDATTSAQHILPELQRVLDEHERLLSSG